MWPSLLSCDLEDADLPVGRIYCPITNLAAAHRLGPIPAPGAYPSRGLEVCEAAPLFFNGLNAKGLLHSGRGGDATVVIWVALRRQLKLSCWNQKLEFGLGLV